MNHSARSTTIRATLLSALVVLSAARRIESFGSFGDYSFYYTAIPVGGTSLAAGFSSLAIHGPNPLAIALALTGAGSITAHTLVVHKELVNQLKVDHDIFLAGGELTPFLQGIYREIRLQQCALVVDGVIDEERISQAIERLVLLADEADGER